MTKKLNLLVGGPKELWPNDLKNGNITGDWIGIDRGNLYLIQMGIKPLVTIGDFDSLTKDEFELVKDSVTDIRQSIPEKDDTDTQLGLKIAIEEFDAERINIYGATGGRIDHLLSNLWIVLDPRFCSYAERVKIIDQQNSIQYFLPGSHTIDKEFDKKYLGFALMNQVRDFTIENAKYKLNDFSSNYPVSFSSNEFVTDKVNFNFESGIVCVIQSKDIKKSTDD